MSVPTFPQRHESWIECSICGFAIPRSEAVVHYKSRKLVCSMDADEPTHSDFLEYTERPAEGGDRVSPQKVQS